MECGEVGSGGIPGQPSLTDDVVINGHVAWVLDSFSGLNAVDVSEPSQPELVVQLDLPIFEGNLSVANGLAFVVDRHNLCVVDIHNPQQPTLLCTLSVDWRQGVAVNDGLTYIARGSQGLCVVDVSDPSSPVMRGSADGEGWATAQGIAVSGDRALVCDSYGDLHVWDVSDPSDLTWIDSLDLPGHAYAVQIVAGHAVLASGEAGVQIVNLDETESPDITASLTLPFVPSGIFTCGAYALVSGPNNLASVNISNPAQPTLMQSLACEDEFERIWAYRQMEPLFSGCDGVCLENVFVRGDLAYVAYDTAGLLIVDIRDSSTYMVLSSLELPIRARRVMVRGDFAFVTTWGGGLHVVDIRDPYAPVLVRTVEFGGWSNALALDGSYAFVLDSGLYVIDISSPSQAHVKGSLPEIAWSMGGGLAVKGEHVFVASGPEIDVVRVSQPSQPVKEGAGIALDQEMMDISIAGDHAFVVGGSEQGVLNVVDISSYGGDEEPEYTHRFVFPHATARNGWETDLVVINASSSTPLNARFQAYREDGVQVGTPHSVSLAPQARVQSSLSEWWDQPQSIGYVTLDADHGDVTGSTRFFLQGRYSAAVPLTQATEEEQLAIPHIATQAGWWTGIALVNTEVEARTVTISFDSGETVQRHLAPLSHDVFLISDLDLVNQPTCGLIQQAAGVVGMELFGSCAPSTNSYLGGLLLPNQTRQDLVFPHVAQGASWWTGLVVTNMAQEACSLTLIPYSVDGVALDAMSFEVQPWSKLIGTTSALGVPDPCAWLEAHADGQVVGLELFGTQNGNQMAGFCVGRSGATTGHVQRLRHDGWTGVALVNPGEEVVTLTLTALAQLRHFFVSHYNAPHEAELSDGIQPRRSLRPKIAALRRLISAIWHGCSGMWRSRAG